MKFIFIVALLASNVLACIGQVKTLTIGSGMVFSPLKREIPRNHYVRSNIAFDLAYRFKPDIDIQLRIFSNVVNIDSDKRTVMLFGLRPIDFNSLMEKTISTVTLTIPLV